MVIIYIDRRCPGTELANNLLYITIATTLALFKILPEIDRDGRPIVPDVKYTTTLTRYVWFVQLRSSVLSDNIGEVIPLLSSAE